MTGVTPEVHRVATWGQETDEFGVIKICRAPPAALTLMPREFEISASCEAGEFAMPTTARAISERPGAHQCVRLEHISQALGAPVVIVTICQDAHPGAHFTFGLDIGVDRSALASALHRQCNRGTTIIPNIAVHPDLSMFAEKLIRRDLRFLIGVSLIDVAGRQSGSISVIATQKGAKAKPVCVEKLRAWGHQFIAQGV